MEQMDLMSWVETKPKPEFAGNTYDPKRDRKRLNTQFTRVQDFMSDKCWHTLDDIQKVCGGTHTGCSARFRDLKNILGWETENLPPEKGGVWMFRVVSFGVKQ